MFAKFYRRPKRVGWIGWIEDSKGNALGYIRMTGEILWMAGVQ